MTGKVAGTLVHVFDQNGNGRYDEFGVDAIAIGKSKVASLLSRVVRLKGELYEFDLSSDGTSATFQPFAGPTGTLDVVSGFRGRAKLTAAVFRSGDYSFELAGEREGLRVPVGEYRFVYGRVERGSASASMRAGRMGSVTVTAVFDGRPVRVSIPASFDEQVDDLLYAPTDGRAREFAVLVGGRTWGPTATDLN